MEEVLLQRCVLVMKWSASFIFLFGLSIRAIRLSLKASVWLMRIKKKRKRKRKMKIHQHPLLIGLHDRDLVCGSVILCLLKKQKKEESKGLTFLFERRLSLINVCIFLPDPLER